MTSREQLIRARLAMLTMAMELRNVAKACKLAGVSRSQFYALKKIYETSGKEGLAPKIRRKPRMPNRTAAEVESQILLKTQDNPHISYLRLANQMRTEGIAVTPSMVRYVWQRHGLSTRSARVQWLRKAKRDQRPLRAGMPHDDRLPVSPEGVLSSGGNPSASTAAGMV